MMTITTRVKRTFDQLEWLPDEHLEHWLLEISLREKYGYETSLRTILFRRERAA